MVYEYAYKSKRTQRAGLATLDDKPSSRRVRGLGEERTIEFSPLERIE